MVVIAVVVVAAIAATTKVVGQSVSQSVSLALIQELDEESDVCRPPLLVTTTTVNVRALCYHMYTYLPTHPHNF